MIFATPERAGVFRRTISTHIQLCCLLGMSPWVRIFPGNVGFFKYKYMCWILERSSSLSRLSVRFLLVLITWLPDSSNEAIGLGFCLLPLLEAHGEGIESCHLRERISPSSHLPACNMKLLQHSWVIALSFWQITLSSYWHWICCIKWKPRNTTKENCLLNKLDFILKRCCPHTDSCNWLMQINVLWKWSWKM